MPALAVCYTYTMYIRNKHTFSTSFCDANSHWIFSLTDASVGCSITHDVMQFYVTPSIARWTNVHSFGWNNSIVLWAKHSPNCIINICAYRNYRIYSIEDLCIPCHRRHHRHYHHHVHQTIRPPNIYPIWLPIRHLSIHCFRSIWFDLMLYQPKRLQAIVSKSNYKSKVEAHKIHRGYSTYSKW